jgi:hypothetical protein
MSELRAKLDDIAYRIAQAYETIDIFQDATDTNAYKPASLRSGLVLVSAHLRRASEDLYDATRDAP